jgi:hypothetical protein
MTGLPTKLLNQIGESRCSHPPICSTATLPATIASNCRLEASLSRSIHACHPNEICNSLTWSTSLLSCWASLFPLETLSVQVIQRCQSGLQHVGCITYPYLSLQCLPITLSNTLTLKHALLNPAHSGPDSLLQPLMPHFYHI